MRRHVPGALQRLLRAPLLLALPWHAPVLLASGFLAPVLLTPAAAASAADSVLLKPKLDAPAEAYVEYTSETTQNLTGPDGKGMEVRTRSVYGLLTKAAAKGDGIELTATLDRLSGSLMFRSADSTAEGVKSVYDTDDPDAEDASPDHRAAFGPMLNAPLKLTLDAKGAATAVEGGTPIRERLLALGEQNFVAKSLADEDFADSQLMSNFGELPLVLLPYREVKAGETWKKTQRIRLPHVGSVIVTYDCKLDGVDKGAGGDTARVSFTGTMTKDADEQPAKDKRLGKIDATFTGTARFAAAEGRFVDIQSETKAKIEVAPWWTKDPAAPLMKIDAQLKNGYTAAAAAERTKRKDEIARRAADARTKREADEAAAMSGPVEPVTPENAPVAWLEWGGPRRDFRSDATGLANRWPKGGPPKLWERPLGDGYSAILCDGDALYTLYSLRDKDDPFKGAEVVAALDARTGKTLWEHKYDAPWPKSMQMEFGPGPHSTPLIVGERLFTVGSTAQLHCLDKKTGKVHWSKDLLGEYKAALHERGYGSSPIAYQGHIVLPVSREKGHAVMAFAQADGALAWKGGDFVPGYASLLLIDAFGSPQLAAFTGKGLSGLDPASGNVLWSVDHPTQFGANISTPVWWPADQFFFISSAYGMGSRGVRLERGDGAARGSEAWFNNKMKIQHGNAVRVGDWVYGSSGDFGPAFLTCVNAKTGESGWRQRGIAKANVVYADGKLIVLDEQGTLFLVKADPTAFRLLAKAPSVCQKAAWTVPTLYGRTLYLRDRANIVALDLGARDAQ